MITDKFVIKVLRAQRWRHYTKTSKLLSNMSLFIILVFIMYYFSKF